MSATAHAFCQFCHGLIVRDKMLRIRFVKAPRVPEKRIGLSFMWSSWFHRGAVGRPSLTFKGVIGIEFRNVIKFFFFFFKLIFFWNWIGFTNDRYDNYAWKSEGSWVTCIFCLISSLYIYINPVMTRAYGAKTKWIVSNKFPLPRFRLFLGVEIYLVVSVLSCGHQKEIVGISAISRQAIRVKKMNSSMIVISSFFSNIIRVIHYLATWFLPTLIVGLLDC